MLQALDSIRVWCDVQPSWIHLSRGDLVVLGALIGVIAIAEVVGYITKRGSVFF